MHHCENISYCDKVKTVWKRSVGNLMLVSSVLFCSSLLFTSLYWNKGKYVKKKRLHGLTHFIHFFVVFITQTVHIRAELIIGLMQFKILIQKVMYFLDSFVYRALYHIDNKIIIKKNSFLFTSATGLTILQW